jgi:hypothetical protein
MQDRLAPSATHATTAAHPARARRDSVRVEVVLGAIGTLVRTGADGDGVAKVDRKILEALNGILTTDHERMNWT